MSLVLIPIKDITYDDEARQRKTLKGIEELASSIDRIGQLNPIILDKDNSLIAGRRRLEACRFLGRETVLARYYDALDVSEKRLVELDENLRRVDLSWQENALAILELHELQSNGSPTWNQNSTAEYCGLPTSVVSECCLVGQALRLGDAKVAACGSYRSAADLLRRRRKLDLESAMAKEDLDDDGTLEDEFFSPVGEPGSDIYNSPHEPDTAPLDQPPRGEGESSSPSPSPTPPVRPAKPTPFRIVSGDFLSLLETGAFKRKYNLLHCDFPYGINFDKSDQGGSKSDDSQYGDCPEVFWRLTHSLIRHQEELLAPSAHMVFWYSMKYHHELVLTLEEGGWFVVPTPLIWHKSCGSGIASDVRRRPKHIYETALFCSRGDREILTLKNDLFSAPIARNKESHVSAKPQEVLEYFLSMLVTEHTDLLDPTCGSGTAVRAAAALGANSALGIELNPEVATTSSTKLSLFLSNRGIPFVPQH